MLLLSASYILTILQYIYSSPPKTAFVTLSYLIFLSHLLINRFLFPSLSRPCMATPLHRPYLIPIHCMICWFLFLKSNFKIPRILAKCSYNFPLKTHTPPYPHPTSFTACKTQNPAPTTSLSCSTTLSRSQVQFFLLFNESNMEQ